MVRMIFQCSSRRAQGIGLTSEIILNTILTEPNFRIWDMSIRGFAREVYFFDWLKKNAVNPLDPLEYRADRANKADLALYNRSKGD